jgi:tetratricopeptide (TPR) repeat protein
MKKLRLLLLLPALGAFIACGGDPKEEKTAAPDPNPELTAISKIIDASPNNDTLLFQRAELYYNLKGYDEALKDLNRAMQIDSMRPAYYHLLADVLLDYGRPNDSKRAIDVLTLASERFPERISTLLKLSEFQLIVRKHTDALGTLNKVLLRDPQNAEAFFMTGRVAIDMGDTTRAIAALQKSVQFDANLIDAWLFLGRIYANRNSLQAIQCYDNALRVDSTNLEAREFKGVFFKRRGEFDKAFEVYREIITRNPDYSNAYFDMGMIYLELDSLAKARDHFDIAIKTDPLFVKAYYYRGITSELQGNVSAAIDDYKQALKMSPKFVEAQEALESLEKK